MNFDQPLAMPRSTHFGNNYFAVYSNKLHRVCHFYSNLEYYNFLTIELDHEVTKFCEQPTEIQILQNNELKRAILDMWVKYSDGREEFQEVKYEAELTGTDELSMRSQEQIRRESEWCKTNNIGFVVRTDKTISKGQFYLRNLNVMAAHLRRYIPTESNYYNPLIIENLNNYTKMTFEELKRRELLPLNNELNHLCYMYSKGVIEMNITDRPLDYRTEISLRQGVENE